MFINKVLNSLSKKPSGTPVINRAHPLARGLQSFFFFNENGGSPHDAITGVTATQSGGPSWKDDTYGTNPAIFFNGGGAGSNLYLTLQQNVNFDPIAGQGMTISALIDLSSSATGAVFSKMSSAGAGYMIWRDNTAPTVLKWFINNAAQLTSTTMPTGVFRLHAVWDGAKLYFYFNGVLANSIAFSTLPTSSGQTPIIGGFFYAGSNNTYAGYTYDFAFWNRALTPNEIAFHTSRPYIFVNNPKFILSGPITAPSIVVQPSNQSAAVGNTATFSVTAAFATSYQWYKNGFAITGATSSSYTTPPVSGIDNGSTFYVIASNTQGSVTSNTVTLTVTGLPSGITGGNFQDALGNPIANGYIIMQLSSDQNVSASKQITAKRDVRVPLDASGNVSGPSGVVFVQPNDLMSDNTAFYWVTVYNANGEIVWGPKKEQVLSTINPYPINNWT